MAAKIGSKSQESHFVSTFGDANSNIILQFNKLIYLAKLYKKRFRASRLCESRIYSILYRCNIIFCAIAWQA